jgi:pimeloyl-ACP methyl ester carboxylesterase
MVEPMKFETRRFRAADGVNVAADVGGNPSHPAVILLHGGGQTRHSWRRAMTELVARGYHVINLDARGHGDSDWAPDGNYSLDVQSRDLCAVVSTLSSKPALVGASMGGVCSLYSVGNAPTPLASALILVDVIPRMDRDGAAKIGAFMRANPDGFVSLDEAAEAVANYNPHRPRPKDVSGLMKNLRQGADGRLRWHWDPKFMSSDRRLDASKFAVLLLDAAERVRIPTLLVRGMQSEVVTEGGIAEFRQRLPSLEVVDVTGAGHMVAGDKNDVFNAGVLSFLQRHLPVSSGSTDTYSQHEGAP